MTESIHTSRQCLTYGPMGEVVAYLDYWGVLQARGVRSGEVERVEGGVSAFAIHGCSRGVAVAYLVGGSLMVGLWDAKGAVKIYCLTRPGEATGQPSVYSWASSAGLCVAVAWAHGPSEEILIQRWVGGGWLANPEAIHEEGADRLEFPSITGNGKGNLWVAFRGAAQGRHHVSGGAFDGQSWSVPRSLVGSGMDPAALCLPDGVILLGWHQGWDVYVGEWRQKGDQAFLSETVKLSTKGHFVGISECSGTILAAWSEWSEVGDVKRDDLRSVGAAIRESRGRWTACPPLPGTPYQLQPGGCGSRLAWWDARPEGGGALTVASVSASAGGSVAAVAPLPTGSPLQTSLALKGSSSLPASSVPSATRKRRSAAVKSPKPLKAPRTP